ncbi:hypothetical protein PZA11_006666 [Diplocarpon coronariae]
MKNDEEIKGRSCERNLTYSLGKCKFWGRRVGLGKSEALGLCKLPPQSYVSGHYLLFGSR